MLEAQKRMLVQKKIKIHAHSHKCERECRGEFKTFPSGNHFGN